MPLLNSIQTVSLSNHTYNYFPLLQGLGLQDNGGLGSSSGGAVSHFEPQVAMLCDSGMHGQEAYHPKYMTEQGEWVSDLYSKATCYKDKMDILNYCKKFASVVTKLSIAGENKETLPHHELSDTCGQDAAIKSATVSEEKHSKQSSVLSANLYLSDSDDSIKDKDYQPDSDTDSDESGSKILDINGVLIYLEKILFKGY
ncbi:unnamed protein product [Diabrotica balteata]|uniref:E1 domain-containing protein n=1 Tax=Diabrotica balteata TaxID=107213 RepID=A0A9N9T6B6_DIABA|nr:unnamed protein product [Diabrotica balteata]